MTVGDSSPYTLLWRRYGLDSNPYFTHPLAVNGKISPEEAFVGRKEERGKLKEIIEMGGDVRYAIVGDAGVGKTSLVNTVRDEAANHGFFTPTNQIELNKCFTGQEIIYLTLSSVYEEAKVRGVEIPDKLVEELEDIDEIARKIEYEGDNLKPAMARQKLNHLFQELVDAILDGGFMAVIVHYDNLDNISDEGDILQMLNDVRDFLMTEKVISLFVGDYKLSRAIRKKKRVEQIFQTPSLRIQPFELEEIKNILEIRYDILKVEDTAFTKPHNDEVIEMLYGLHEGNLRSILKALSVAVRGLPKGNKPIPLNKERAARILYQTAEQEFIEELSTVMEEILRKVLEEGPISPSDLANNMDKQRQNVSKYLKKLEKIGAVREVPKEELEFEPNGRKKYYEATLEVRWLKFEDMLSEEIRRDETQSSISTFSGGFDRTGN
jgi:predicted transcriptional regulator